MDFTFGASVYCDNGFVGKAESLLINPIKKVVTHFVLKAKVFRDKAYLVPLDLVESVKDKRVDLSCELEAITKLELFNETAFVQPLVAEFEFDDWDVWVWPFAEMLREDTFYLDKLPLAQLALRRGSKVRTKDAFESKLRELVIDKNSGMITHLVLIEKDLMQEKEVFIPVNHIKHISEDYIDLAISKDVLDELLHIRVKRNYRLKRAA